jgi:hypothetical protein
MKNFLFKPNLFKGILNQLAMIPAFVTGFVGYQLFLNFFSISLIPLTTCIIVITVGVLWISWALAYILVNKK